MNAIKPYAHIIDIDFGNNVLKKIELVGRTCYKSTDAITPESAPKFVANLIKRGHEAMVEHASFCFELTEEQFFFMREGISAMEAAGFKSFLRFTAEERYLVSGNVRAWRDYFKVHRKCFGGQIIFLKDFIEENPILFPEWQQGDFYWMGDEIKPMKSVHIGDLKSELEFLTHCDITVQFVVDRGITHEIVRHRPASFAQESTRYCNYAKDKFGGQLTFIIPEFFQYKSPEWELWKATMEECEKNYLKMISLGVPPEQARTILPHSLKTELIMTANLGEWKHFFELRACNVTGKAHPQILEVSRPLLDEFKNTISVVFDDLIYE